MLKSSARSVIRLRGVRHNNLKNFDLDLPLNQLIVITGLSGSGKSSLAFDTLFAEGQRRYIETFSPYARQFLDRMDKPQVDSIEGIPPAIAIEQRNAVRTTRSTVGTMTEICDYMKMLWPLLAQLHCRECGQAVRKDSPQMIWDDLKGGSGEGRDNHESGGRVLELLITFDVPLSEKLSFEESLVLVSKQGYQRLLVDGQILRLDELVSKNAEPGEKKQTSLTIIQDRIKPAAANRARFVEACEQAYHFGKGKLIVWEIHPPASLLYPRFFSNRLHCAQCDIEYREPSPALFSFNNPVGACPACRGFGRVISIDYNLAIPDRSKTLAEGAVRPWQTGQGAESQADLRRACRHFEIPMDVPFSKLPKKWQDFVIEGEPDYGKDEEHEWPRAWYGVKGYFRWLESKAYKMHVRVLLSRYRAYTPCPDCNGKRFQPDALLYRVGTERPTPDQARKNWGEPSKASAGQWLTLADFYELPIRDAFRFIETLAAKHKSKPTDPLAIVMGEIRSRLGYLNEAGLGYLTLNRPTRSLSGGETERVNLTTCLGSRLVNTLFVLDEPSVGLHPRDTERLVRILQNLRDAGNTTVVVEHEANVMRAADQIVDLGPGHGATGGQVVFQGSYRDILKAPLSLTGQYLSGRKQIPIPARRASNQASPLSRSAREQVLLSDSLMLNEAPAPYVTRLAQGTSRALRITQATLNNLRDLEVTIPLGLFVCVTGVSGSGKTTLVREVLLPAVKSQLGLERSSLKASDRLSPDQNGENEDEDSATRIPNSAQVEGAGQLGQVVLVDQSILAKTPRSNPAVYIGAFDDIREFFAQSEMAEQRGLGPSAFSFNSAQGQCERCRGAGFEKIEMQFLSDVFIRCPDCNGRRYRQHILQVKVSPPSTAHGPQSKVKGLSGRRSMSRGLSIADLLDSTIEEAISFLCAFPDSRPARKAVENLKLLVEVGLGYLKLGQPINTLSGGESQRLKLVRHLAEASAGDVSMGPVSTRNGVRTLLAPLPTLFLFDEPTTGLHFEDVQVLLKVFQRLVNAGHSVLVIEHNLDVIKSADWVIDLGPDAGDQGGQLVAAGTPEEIVACPRSHTGKALRALFGASRFLDKAATKALCHD